MNAASLPRPRLLPRPRRLLAALSDERLATAARRGEGTAFEALYDRHHRGLLALCRHILASNEDAEDALQQTFASAFRALSSNDEPAQIKPWLYAIARNRCLNMLRARRETPVEDLQQVSTAGLSEEVERRTELRELLADLDHLPERQKTALILSELGDLDHREIAQLLECEVKQVKALVFQARSALIKDRRAREIPCAEIREHLATTSAGGLRRSFLRRHIRVCSGCADFRDEVRRQRGMLAVALPVAPSLGLKESALAAVGYGGAGGAGGGGLIAALGAHGAAKVATIAITAGGALGGVAVTHPGLVGKAQGAVERVASEERGGVSAPSVGSRGRSTASPNGYFDSEGAAHTARKQGRRREIRAAGDPAADEREEARGLARGGEGPARAIPERRPQGQDVALPPGRDRSRGKRRSSPRNQPKGSPRDQSREGKSSKRKAAGKRRRARVAPLGAQPTTRSTPPPRSRGSRAKGRGSGR